MSEHEASRRNVVTGLAAAGVALPLLAACGSSGGGANVNGTTSGGTGGDGGSTASGGSTAAAGGSGGGITTAEIPVGGGKIFQGRGIVVTQPSAGQFKAFSAVCTHQGCPVTEIQGGSIDCLCHGSQFSIVDGSVQGGPAPAPLPEKTVTVTGTTLTVS